MQSFEWGQASWAFEKVMRVRPTAEAGTWIDWEAVERRQTSGLREEGCLGGGRGVVEGHELRCHGTQARRMWAEAVTERRFVQAWLCWSKRDCRLESCKLRCSQSDHILATFMRKFVLEDHYYVYKVFFGLRFSDQFTWTTQG